jgi:ElaB/YqjD/DUF883 family membrane-anchored ribosome-binding protein
MPTKPSTQQTSANGHGVEAATAAIAATTDNARAAVSREFHNFVSDIEDLVKATTLLTGEELTLAKARLSERVASARQSVEEVGGAIAQQARKSASITNDYVHEQPWKAIGAGAAIGFLLGVVVARRA